MFFLLQPSVFCDFSVYEGELPKSPYESSCHLPHGSAFRDLYEYACAHWDGALHPGPGERNACVVGRLEEGCDELQHVIDLKGNRIMVTDDMVSMASITAMLTANGSNSYIS